MEHDRRGTCDDRSVVAGETVHGGENDPRPRWVIRIERPGLGRGRVEIVLSLGRLEPEAQVGPRERGVQRVVVLVLQAVVIRNSDRQHRELDGKNDEENEDEPG